VATITIKNIPDELYVRLKAHAKANRRSINSEIILCIERAVRNQQLDVDEMLASARILREKTRGYAISDDELEQAKDEGRP
jgi:antitoxin FitA